MQLVPTSYTEINRIHRTAFDDVDGTLVVTSSKGGEGSSVLAYIMAQRAAENGKKTLLVDLDLKQSWITVELGLERKEWRLDQRKSNSKLSDLIVKAEGFDNLYYIATPADDISVKFLKDAGRARTFFQVLESQFDQVVVDTSPVNAHNRYNADPVLLAAGAARTILVMLAGKTPRDIVVQTVNSLKDAGANLEGVIVNDRFNPSLKKELLTFIRKFQNISPSFYGWMKHKILKCESLG